MALTWVASRLDCDYFLMSARISHITRGIWMKLHTGWTSNTWSWIGLAFLSISALWWLLMGLVIAARPEQAVYIVEFGLLISAVPLGLGVYSIIRSRKALAVERKQRGFKDEIQDKARDEVCKGLLDIGLDARIAKRPGDIYVHYVQRLSIWLQVTNKVCLRPVKQS